MLKVSRLSEGSVGLQLLHSGSLVQLFKIVPICAVQILKKLTQEAQGALRSAWPFVRWNLSFMDRGNVAKVTYLQTAVYF